MIFVSSACLKNNFIKDTVECLACKGVDNIELSGGTCRYESIEDDLIYLKNEYGITYSCHAYFPPPPKDFVINLASCNDKIYQMSINHYIDCMDMMSRVGIDTLSVHAGFLVEVGVNEIGKKFSATVIYDNKEAYDRFVEAYKILDKNCKDRGIRLFLENNVISYENYNVLGCNNYMMMTDFNSINYMRDKLNFNLLLDLAHLNVSANTLGFDFVEQCRELSHQAKWIHLSDNNGIIDEHNPLEKTSIILDCYWQFFDQDINVTLETNGTIEEIIKSKKIIEKGQM